MKCPYCAEAVNDEAIVCRFCQKDLFFLRPLLDRIGQLEASLIALAAERTTAKQTAGYAGFHSSRQACDPEIVLAMGISICLSIAFYWLSWLDIVGSRFDMVLESLSAASPAIGGLWLGFCNVRLKWTHCVFIGLLLGIAGFTQFFFLHHSYANLFGRLYFLLDRTPFVKDAPIRNLPQMFLAYVGAGMCMFPTGYAVGDRLGNRNRAVPRSIYPGSDSKSAAILMLNQLSPLLVAALGLISSLATAMLKSR